MRTMESFKKNLPVGPVGWSSGWFDIVDRGFLKFTNPNCEVGKTMAPFSELCYGKSTAKQILIR